MKKVLYEELLPEEFVQRMQEMPVAYLPLGTLEWHRSAYASWSRWNPVKRTVCPGSGKSWRCGTSNTLYGS